MKTKMYKNDNSVLRHCIEVPVDQVVKMEARVRIAYGDSAILSANLILSAAICTKLTSRK